MVNYTRPLNDDIDDSWDRKETRENSPSAEEKKTDCPIRLVHEFSQISRTVC